MEALIAFLAVVLPLATVYEEYIIIGRKVRRHERERSRLYQEWTADIDAWLANGKQGPCPAGPPPDTFYHVLARCHGLHRTWRVTPSHQGRR